MQDTTGPFYSLRFTCAIVIMVASASMFGRILAGDSRSLSSNDRSRWATIRALVESSRYAIGQREWKQGIGPYRDSGIVSERGWETVDKVLRPDTGELYSSKPPFLSTLIAGEYWLLKKGLGWSITQDRWAVQRAILLTVNWLPLTLYLILLATTAEGLGTTAWGRVYVIGSASFGTFLTTFAVVLNNHTVAACSALFALTAALRVWSKPSIQGASVTVRDTGKNALLFALAGFFASFAACADLPAAAFTVALGAILLAWAPWRTLLFYVPAAAVPVAVFLFTNYLAIGQLRPAYSEFGGPWYEYEGSHWKSKAAPGARGIDAAGQVEGKIEYAFHLLEGHHGLFSLSPIYLLSLAGIGYAFSSSKRPGAEEETVSQGRDQEDLCRARNLRMIAGLTAFLTVVVVSFYVIKTSNYGGRTSGPRWFFWLTPFLLLSMVPAADRLAGSRSGRLLGYVLLAISVASASYPAGKPWSHPWLYDLMEWLGWIAY